ncbi:right-handed parallel beta-helix repeat-containing protein [Pseudopedobacter beijingensis]|uniref:Right-handed parallel beta-helix repeat-containing protein n=1 Tax=Pseudopedobacter beijingensis TaxID=1207056 RepID=A0ABW4IEU1_9SPHI
MKKLYFSFIVLFAITWTQVVAQTTYYVKTDGNNSNDGLSWETAKATIADAIALANPANGDMIFVAKGTYIASGNNAVINPGAKVGLKFYGGFAGTETSLAERVFGTTAADSTNLVGNNYSVVVNYLAGGSTITTTLYDGFTIKNGNRTGSGGGMHNNISLTVNNCIFKENISSASGAGIYNSNNQITLLNCKFYGNKANTNGGGGILVSSGSSATITNCLFDGNITASGHGAGVSTYHTDANNPTTVNVSNCTFIRNEATGTGGGMYNYQNIKISILDCTFADNTATTNGGGVFNNTSADATITNSTFTSNIATLNGGGLYNSASSNGAITNCTFTSNIANNTTTATGGGGLFSTGAGPTVSYCKFMGNKAANGGGMLLTNATATTQFVNCLFSGNMATNAGGAGYINNSGTGSSSTPSFTNCTIAANYAKNTGGGLYNTGSNNGTTVTVTNSIIYGNSGGIANSVPAGATATVSYSNVQYTGATNEVDYNGGTNFNVDPNFTNLPAFSSTAPFTTGDYTLSSNSGSVINKGFNDAINGYNFDITGVNQRIYDTTVDMGAYEYQSVLPIKLSSFEARYQHNHVQLTWKTISESNNSHFEILRSDGVAFQVIDRVKGTGDSNQEITYHYTDYNPLSGVSYYQLRQVDFDNQSELSKIIPVSIAPKQTEIRIYTGESGEITIGVYAMKSGRANIIITDISGHKLLNQSVEIKEGYSTFENHIGLKPGVYVVSLQMEGETVSAKFVK